jgi:hypothetical protein
MKDEQRRVRDDSDELLHALQDLKQLERRKREADISSPPFHDLADEVALQARRVFDIALREEHHGDQTERTSVSIDEVSPSERLR